MYKYKPTSFEKMYINQNIRYIINNIINNRNINILFVGNNESGKTTIINLLHKLINNSLLINNLKDKGIKTFRTDIKFYCQLTIKHKTLLIDDYEYINESTQYIIKVLMDTYKKNLYIASVKDIKKIIEPLQNKFMIIKLDNITNDYLNVLLNNVIKEEKMALNDKCIKYIIKISNFSVNKMYNYLEKLKLMNERITYNKCLSVLTNISHHIFEKIIHDINEKNVLNVYNNFNNLYIKGYSIVDIYDIFYTFIKICDNISEDKRYKIIRLLCEYITASDTIGEISTELLLFSYELCNIEL